LLQGFIERQASRGVAQFFHETPELAERRRRALSQRTRVEQIHQRIPQAQFPLPGVLFDLLHGGAPDAARRHVDHTQQAHIVPAAGHQFQVGQRVLHFRALVETETANHQVLAAPAPQRLLDLPALRIGAIKHGEALLGRLHEDFIDGVGDEVGFTFGVRRLEQPDGVPLSRLGPQCLPLALYVVSHYGPGGVQHVLRRAIVLLQADHCGPREVMLEIQDVVNVGAAPTVDGLVLVAHHAEVLVAAGN